MIKFAVAAPIALSLLFLTSCGDGKEVNDKTIRISITPVTKSVEAGEGVELTVDARNTAIKWPEPGDVEGSFTVVNNKAKYVPPSVEGTYRFSVAAEADPSKIVTARITVVFADPTITIKPDPPPEIKVSKTIQFTADLDFPFGQTQQDPTWEVVGECGTIDDTGLFSAAWAGDCVIKASVKNKNNRIISESVTVKIKEPTLDDIVDDMTAVRGGRFTIGCSAGQRNDCPDTALPEQSVTLNDFYIGKYEVTQFLWKQIMGVYYNPSRNNANNLPVETVSWDDLQTFFERLNDRTGKDYRLPTEAEWEYAARGGTQSKGYIYSGSDTLDKTGWYADNSDGKTHPVGMKQANELGLHDMSGNVAEWVDGGSLSGQTRIVRGGNYNYDEEFARVFYRGRCTGICDPNPGLGFRLASSSR